MTSEGGGTSYAWNGEEELTSPGSPAYLYDGDRLRVKKSGTGVTETLYWRSTAINVLAESNLSGTLTREYIYFGGERAAMRDVSANQVYYWLSDHQGSVRVATNATGTVCYEADYHPFGSVQATVTNTCEPAYKFAGYERDSETGLDYAVFRYYNPRIARFMSPDFLAGEVADPQSLDLYTFVLNKPS